MSSLGSPSSWQRWGSLGVPFEPRNASTGLLPTGWIQRRSERSGYFRSSWVSFQSQRTPLPSTLLVRDGLSAALLSASFGLGGSGDSATPCYDGTCSSNHGSLTIWDYVKNVPQVFNQTETPARPAAHECRESRARDSRRQRRMLDFLSLHRHRLSDPLSADGASRPCYFNLAGNALEKTASCLNIAAQYFLKSEAVPQST